MFKVSAFSYNHACKLIINTQNMARRKGARRVGKEINILSIQRYTCSNILCKFTFVGSIQKLDDKNI